MPRGTAAAGAPPWSGSSRAPDEFLARRAASPYPSDIPLEEAAMQRIHSRSATLVVIEYGANWPRWLSPERQGDMAVVAQHYEGPSGSLVTQVATRVARLEGMGWSFDSVV